MTTLPDLEAGVSEQQKNNRTGDMCRMELGDDQSRLSSEAPSGGDHLSGLCPRPDPYSCEIRPSQSPREKTPGQPANALLTSVGHHLIFLCLAQKYGSGVACVVRCKRPTVPRQYTTRKKRVQAQSQRREGAGKREAGRDLIESVAIYPQRPDEAAVECDSDIFERLRQHALATHGAWKAWVPFYGVTSVAEIKVSRHGDVSYLMSHFHADQPTQFKFDGSANNDGTYPITLTHLNIDSIRKKHTSSRQQCLELAGLADGMQHRADFGELWCDGDMQHSEACDAVTNFSSQPCARLLAEQAEEHLRRLDRLHEWKSNLLDPQAANGGKTLSGMAQSSCVYLAEGGDQLRGHLPDECTLPTDLPGNVREFDTKAEFRGLYVEFGWQRDALRHQLPVCASCALVTVFLAWLLTIAVAGSTKDWQTACGLGSLALASIAFLWGKLG